MADMAEIKENEDFNKWYDGTTNMAIFELRQRILKIESAKLWACIKKNMRNAYEAGQANMEARYNKQKEINKELVDENEALKEKVNE